MISMFTMSSNSIRAEDEASSELIKSKGMLSDTRKLSMLNTIVQTFLLKQLNKQITALMKTVMAKKIKYMQKIRD